METIDKRLKITSRIENAFYGAISHIQEFVISVRCFVDKFISPKFKRKIVKCVDKQIKRKFKMLFKKFIETLDNITLLDVFENFLLFLSIVAFWIAFIALFILVNSSNPWREIGIILSCAGMIGIYFGYNKQKEKERIEMCELECKKYEKQAKEAAKWLLKEKSSKN